MTTQPGELSLARNMLWNTVGSTIRLACNWLITVAVVRFAHGFDAAGVLLLAMTIANLVTPFADFRLRTLQVTDVDDELSSGEYVGLRILAVALAMCVGAVYTLMTCTQDVTPAVLLYLVQALVAAFIEVSHAVDQRHWRMDYIGISYALQGISNIILFSLALLATNSLEISIVVMGLGTIAVGVLYSFPRAARFESMRPIIELRKALPKLASLLPLVLAQVASSAVLTIPRQYLLTSAGSAALGIYAAITAPTVVIQMGAAYIYSPLLGRFAQLFKDDKHSALVLLGKVIMGIIAVALVASAGFLLAGEPLLVFVFGEKIQGYAFLLPPALICTLLTALCWFLNDLLLALRDYLASFLGNTVAAVMALLVTVPLVSSFAQNGVSMVGIVAYLAGVLVLGLFMLRDYGRLDS